MSTRFENLKEGDVLSTPQGSFIFFAEKEGVFFLSHPLLPKDVLISRNKADLVPAPPGVLTSDERGFHFVGERENLLDFNTTQDLKALKMLYVSERRLTSKQKYFIAQVLGRIAKIELDNNIQAAVDLIKANQGVLDEFNARWHKNFEAFFSGEKVIEKPQTRNSIFNMAGFVMSELAPITFLRGSQK